MVREKSSSRENVTEASTEKKKSSNKKKSKSNSDGVSKEFKEQMDLKSILVHMQS